MVRLACVDLHPLIPLVDPVGTVVVERLRCFTPHVESADTEGVFWLDAEGLDCLYRSLKAWGEHIDGDMRSLGFEAGVAVGFSRFGTFALARSLRGVLVLDSREQEATASGRVPLKRLDISDGALRALSRLGKRTVADLLSLPAGGILERFGPELHRLHRMASRDIWDPLCPDPEVVPLVTCLDLDYPETDAARLTFFVKRLLGQLLCRVNERCEAVSAIRLELGFHSGPPSVQQLKPAEPTLDEMQLIDLVRLRLESLVLREGVEHIAIETVTVAATREQMEMFRRKPLRDLNAADRALARLAAEFGPDAVVRATLRKGHLPEARFAFERLSHVRAPVPDDSASTPEPVLIRRIFTKPVPLQKTPVVGPRGCHLKGMDNAPATRVTGPYVVSGGWWVREVHREYYFAETEAGEVLWVYYDRRRRSWFLHGEVE